LVNQAKPSYAREKNTTRNDKNMDNDGFTHVAHQRRRTIWTPIAMWQSPEPNFTQSFSSYYFKCNGYGYRIFECKYNISPRNFSSRNTFAPLMDYAKECFNYHNYGPLQETTRVHSLPINFSEDHFSHRA